MAQCWEDYFFVTKGAPLQFNTAKLGGEILIRLLWTAQELTWHLRQMNAFIGFRFIFLGLQHD